jgi:hypothetical protein
VLSLVSERQGTFTVAGGTGSSLTAQSQQERYPLRFRASALTFVFRGRNVGQPKWPSERSWRARSRRRRLLRPWPSLTEVLAFVFRASDLSVYEDMVTVVKCIGDGLADKPWLLAELQMRQTIQRHSFLVGAFLLRGQNSHRRRPDAGSLRRCKDRLRTQQPRPNQFYADASLLFVMNASRSALIVAASVVGIPCGKPR